MPKKEKAAPQTWKQRKRNITKRWTLPFQAIEWACEWTAYLLSNWGFIDVLEYGGKLAVVLTAAVYILSADQRKQAAADARKAKHYQAWQVINSAAGKSGDGGRSLALVELANDGVSLSDVDLAFASMSDLTLTNAKLNGALFGGARLQNVKLAGSKLAQSVFVDSSLQTVTFDGAFLNEADFAHASFNDVRFVGSSLEIARFTNSIFMGRSDFSQANLHSSKMNECAFVEGVFVGCQIPESDLRSSDFSHVDFRKANLRKSNLESSQLVAANLTDADCARANLQSADLESAICINANFFEANLANCNLLNIQWQGITNMTRANIYGVRNAPDGFIEWATNKMGAVSVTLSDTDTFLEWKLWLRKSAKRPISSTAVGRNKTN